eukprot:Gb_41429 [translate_table: standard]
MGSRMLGRDSVHLSKQIFLIYRLWQQSSNHHIPIYPAQTHLNARHMSVFNEFSKRVKGEVQSNPELQKSIKELKEKAGELKGMTEDLKVRHADATKGGPDFGRDGTLAHAERSRQQSICTSMLMQFEWRRRPGQSRSAGAALIDSWHRAGILELASVLCPNTDTWEE